MVHEPALDELCWENQPREDEMLRSNATILLAICTEHRFMPVFVYN